MSQTIKTRGPKRRFFTKPSKGVLPNAAGVLLGGGLGIGIVFATMGILGNETGQPYAVIAIGVGAAAALGALLRVAAHFKVFPASDAIDAAGKALAFVAALMFLLLAREQLGAPANASGEQVTLTAHVETAGQ